MVASVQAYHGRRCSHSSSRHIEVTMLMNSPAIQHKTPMIPPTMMAATRLNFFRTSTPMQTATNPETTILAPCFHGSMYGGWAMAWHDKANQSATHAIHRSVFMIPRSACERQPSCDEGFAAEPEVACTDLFGSVAFLAGTQDISGAVEHRNDVDLVGFDVVDDAV